MNNRKEDTDKKKVRTLKNDYEKKMNNLEKWVGIEVVASEFDYPLKDSDEPAPYLTLEGMSALATSILRDDADAFVATRAEILCALFLKLHDMTKDAAMKETLFALAKNSFTFTRAFDEAFRSFRG